MVKQRFGSQSGPTQRQLRVGELIRRTLSDVLMRGETHQPELDGVSITVGEVRTSPDLKVATVYVLPLGGANADTVLAALDRAKGELRRALTKNVSLKFSPELRFALDETFDRMDQARAMLSEDRVRRDIQSTQEDETG